MLLLLLLLLLLLKMFMLVAAEVLIHALAGAFYDPWQAGYAQQLVHTVQIVRCCLDAPENVVCASSTHHSTPTCACP